ncbi:MAG: hypothetical protein IJE49_04760 [Agathobacter sp.]|nr:hypothetical protein [Agathobacter sp.]
MELIKNIVKQFYPLIIMLGCVSFAIWMFFSTGLRGKDNVFEGAGEVFSPVLDTGNLKNEGLSYVEGAVSDYVPVMTYTGGTQNAGSYIAMKSLFDVTMEDGSVVNGSEESGFTIYLTDIQNQAGDSVLMFLNADDIASMEEILVPFVYEKEQDILCCFQGGIYTVYVKICGTNGGEHTYVFQLPVEHS